MNETIKKKKNMHLAFRTLRLLRSHRIKTKQLISPCRCRYLFQCIVGSVKWSMPWPCAFAFAFGFYSVLLQKKKKKKKTTQSHNNMQFLPFPRAHIPTIFSTTTSLYAMRCVCLLCRGIILCIRDKSSLC